MVTRKNQSGINISARFSVRDFLLALSMLGSSGNLFWCWHHDKQIQELQRADKNQKEIRENEGTFGAIHARQATSGSTERTATISSNRSTSN